MFATITIGNRKYTVKVVNLGHLERYSKKLASISNKAIKVKVIK